MGAKAGADAHDMASVKARLDQIVDAVSDDSIPLDEALSYYEEAVKLGMEASELMEADLLGSAQDVDEGASGQGPAEGQGD